MKFSKQAVALAFVCLQEGADAAASGKEKPHNEKVDFLCKAAASGKKKPHYGSVDFVVKVVFKHMLSAEELARLKPHYDDGSISEMTENLYLNVSNKDENGNYQRLEDGHDKKLHDDDLDVLEGYFHLEAGKPNAIYDQQEILGVALAQLFDPAPGPVEYFVGPEPMPADPDDHDAFRKQLQWFDNAHTAREEQGYGALDKLQPIMENKCEAVKDFYSGSSEAERDVHEKELDAMTAKYEGAKSEALYYKNFCKDIAQGEDKVGREDARYKVELERVEKQHKAKKARLESDLQNKKDKALELFDAMKKVFTPDGKETKED